MSANPPQMTESEYFEFEMKSDMRHEFINGQVIKFNGRSPNHNLISVSLTMGIYGGIKAKPEYVGMGSQMRVHVPTMQAHLYPDMTVSRYPEYTNDPVEALLNPLLIIEILSPHTELTDRREKFQIYRALPSFREYLLVSQESPLIERFYLRDDGQWEFDDVAGLDSSITLKSIDCTLTMSDVYQNVTFEDGDT